MDSLSTFFNLFVGFFVGLFAIVDPLGVLPVWMSLTRDLDHRARRVIVLRTVRYVTIILFTFLILGNAILEFFGISMMGLKIAGGLLLIYAAFDLMGEGKRKKVRGKKADASPAAEATNPQAASPYPVSDGGKAKDDADDPEQDIAFSPLAMPLLSGPGAIAVIIGMTGRVGYPWEISKGAHLRYLAAALAIGLIIYSIYLTFNYSGKLARYLSPNVLVAITRIMAFILLAIGVQFFLDAIEEFLLMVDTEAHASR